MVGMLTFACVLMPQEGMLSISSSWRSVHNGIFFKKIFQYKHHILYFTKYMYVGREVSCKCKNSGRVNVTDLYFSAFKPSRHFSTRLLKRISGTHVAVCVCFRVLHAAKLPTIVSGSDKPNFQLTVGEKMSMVLTRVKAIGSERWLVLTSIRTERSTYDRLCIRVVTGKVLSATARNVTETQEDVIRQSSKEARAVVLNKVEELTYRTVPGSQLTAAPMQKQIGTCT